MSSTAKKIGLPSRVRMRHSSHFVEELTSRNSEPIGRMLPLASVEPDPDQPRSTMGDLAELTQSVRDKGVLEPILVRPTAADDSPQEEFMIISGERRYRAAMAAGLVEIPAIVMEVEADEALEIALIENLQRKDLTPFEEADGYRALADRFGYTHERIAESVGKSRTVVTESLALLQMSPRVREAAQALGVQTKSTLLEILKAESEEEMIHLLEEVNQRGLSRDDLRRQQRGKSNDGEPPRKPFMFSVRAPDKSFKLSLRFRQSSVTKSELIETLEGILEDLRQADDPTSA